MYYSSGNYEAFAHPLPPEGVENKQAYIVGSGLAGLAAACFLVRDGRMPGEKIHILERDPRAGGGCDGWEYPGLGFTMRGGREMDNHFEVMWDLFRDIPSIEDPSVSVLDYYYWLNKRDPNYSLCRATVDRGRDAHTDNKFNLSDKACMEIMNLFFTPEEELQDKVITEYFSDEVLNSNFWLYWRTMFAFENWHSALEMKRYVTRFVHHLGGLPDFSALRFTRYNQYESMILPMVNYLEARRRRLPVQHPRDRRALQLRRRQRRQPQAGHGNSTGAREQPGGHRCRRGAARRRQDGSASPDTGREETIPLTENDLRLHHARQPGGRFLLRQPGQASRASHPSSPLVTGWDLWKKIAAAVAGVRPSREVHAATRRRATGKAPPVTTLDEKILPYIEAICKRDPLSGGVVTGGIVSVKDSSWLLSWTDQPPAAVPRPARGAGVRVALRPVHRRARRLREEDPCAIAPARKSARSGCTTWACPRRKSRSSPSIPREHGALHDALHHGLLHAPRRWRPSARRA